MHRRPTNRIAALKLLTVAIGFAAIVSGVPAAGAEVTAGFHDLSFDAACAEAKKADKVVFIDFFTTWCGPCKMMDRSTFKDEAVVKLLKDKAVAIKVDAEKQRDLSQRYKVSSYPMLLFVKPDGTEIGRLSGYREAKQLVPEATDLLNGITPMERARLDVQNEGKNDPLKHHKLGDEYLNAGKFDDAMKEYLWCFDEGTTANPGYAGVRSSYLLARLAQLSQIHPPARAAVLERRDSAAQRLVEKPSDTAAAMDFAAINRQFGESAQTMAMFDRLREKDNWDANVRLVLRDALFDELFTNKRYADLLGGDAAAEVESDIQRLKQMEPMMARDPRSATVLKQRMLTKWAHLLEATLATQSTEKAQRLAQAILSYDRSDQTLQALADAAKSAGKPEFADFVRNPASAPATQPG